MAIQSTASSRPPLLSIPEAATLLTISPETVRQWFHDGRLKGIRIGHSIRLFADGVNALLNPTTDAVKGVK
jgi:excisionase family DNA binding protein